MFNFKYKKIQKKILIKIKNISKFDNKETILDLKEKYHCFKLLK